MRQTNSSSTKVSRLIPVHLPFEWCLLLTLIKLNIWNKYILLTPIWRTVLEEGDRYKCHTVYLRLEEASSVRRSSQIYARRLFQRHFEDHHWSSHVTKCFKTNTYKRSDHRSFSWVLFLPFGGLNRVRNINKERTNEAICKQVRDLPLHLRLRCTQPSFEYQDWKRIVINVLECFPQRNRKTITQGEEWYPKNHVSSVRFALFKITYTK